MNQVTTQETPSRWCVLLPCAKNETWAVPQNCLAEIVTLPSDADQPPRHLTWRGQEVAVLNLDPRNESPWRDARAGTGLVAIMLGLKGGAWEYCGVALRGEGLAMKDLAGEAIEDAPDQALDSSASAFRMGGEVFQVPNLDDLHTRESARI